MSEELYKCIEQFEVIIVDNYNEEKIKKYYFGIEND